MNSPGEKGLPWSPWRNVKNWKTHWLPSYSQTLIPPTCWLDHVWVTPLLVTEPLWANRNPPPSLTSLMPWTNYSASLMSIKSWPWSTYPLAQKRDLIKFNPIPMSISWSPPSSSYTWQGGDTFPPVWHLWSLLYCMSLNWAFLGLGAPRGSSFFGRREMGEMGGGMIPSVPPTISSSSDSATLSDTDKHYLGSKWSSPITHLRKSRFSRVRNLPKSSHPQSRIY